MENLKETILYVNIKGENGMREVREARFAELTVKPCNFRFQNRSGKLLSLYGSGLSFKIEVAGIGVVTMSKLRCDFDGGLYRTESSALSQTSPMYSYNKNNGSSSLSLDWAGIMFENLNLRSSSTTIEKYGSQYDYDFKIRAISYVWTGTCPKEKEIYRKFHIDLLDNKLKTFNDTTEDKLGTLYATKEMCEKANTPTIFRFDSKPKQVEKIVTFEITLGVTVDKSEMPECEEEDAIVAAMSRLRTCDDEVLFDACVSCTDYPYQR